MRTARLVSVRGTRCRGAHEDLPRLVSLRPCAVRNRRGHRSRAGLRLQHLPARGALNHRVPKERLRLLTPWDDLVLYQWGSCTAEDYFCPVCGILPFRRPSDATLSELIDGVQPFDGWAINVRCLDDVDLDAIPVRRICGSRIALPSRHAAARVVDHDDTMLQFDVYGRLRVGVMREDDRWVLYRLGSGTRVRDASLSLPDGLEPDGIAAYLDDLLHELSGPGRSVRRIF